MISAIVSAYKTTPSVLAGRIVNLTGRSAIKQIVVVCQHGSVEHDLLIDMAGLTIVTTSGIPTIYKAWNLGIQASTQPLLTNANCDDRLYIKGDQYLADALEQHPECGVVYGNNDISDLVGGLPINRHEWIHGGFEELLRGCFVGPMPVWRKSLHEKYGMFDEEMRTSGDYEFWLRIAAGGTQFFHLERCVGVFYSHKSTASRREPLRAVWEDARARSRYTN